MFETKIEARDTTIYLLSFTRCMGAWQRSACSSGGRGRRCCTRRAAMTSGKVPLGSIGGRAFMLFGAGALGLYYGRRATTAAPPSSSDLRVHGRRREDAPGRRDRGFHDDADADAVRVDSDPRTGADHDSSIS